MSRIVDPAFYHSLVAEDELGVVVRAHIHIEASILDFLHARVQKPKLLPRLPYEARLRLACALGLNEEYFECLKALGDLRNHFGHNLSATISGAKANELYTKLPPFAKDVTLATYAKTVVQHDDMPSFEGLSPKDRFVFIALVLKMFALNSAVEAKENTGDT